VVKCADLREGFFQCDAAYCFLKRECPAILMSIHPFEESSMTKNEAILI
jgi:hypothetical protein